MLAHQRHERIIEAVRAGGSVRVSDLADLLGVSYMTVRRDLDVLDERGHIAKVHGGATSVEDRSTDEPGFDAKAPRQRSEKLAIAQLAADMVTPGAAIGLTAGTTTFTMAALLLDIPGLTVVTNAPGIAQQLYRSPRADLTVVLTGGHRTRSDALIGPIATAALRNLHVDMLFMGIHGMDAEGGFTTPNIAEAETNQAFVKASRQLVVVADHTKWGIRGLATIAPLSDANVLISDDRLPDIARETFEEFDTDVRFATEAEIESAAGATESAARSTAS